MSKISDWTVSSASTISASVGYLATTVSSSGVLSHQALGNLLAAAAGVTYGHVTDTTQTIAGSKTFTSAISAPNISASGTLNTGDQTITLSGDVSGTGQTGILTQVIGLLGYDLPLLSSSGPLAWDAVAEEWTIGGGGSGGLQERIDTVITTGSIASYATATGTFTIQKTADMHKFVSNYKCWIRIYSTYADLVADSGRLITSDPVSGSGICADIYLYDSLSLRTAPVLQFRNDDSPTDNIGYYSIKNMDTSSHDYSVTITYLPLEA